MRVTWLTGAGALLAVALCAASQVLAQGAGDNQGERQVKPQIIQNPIIPGLVDPEPPFTTAKQDAVLSRPRIEYNPIGLEAGGTVQDIKYLGRGQILESFLLFPKVETEILFDSNILAADNNEVADFIGTVRPELELHSNWDNHELFVRGFGEVGRYLSNNRENFYRYGIEVGTRLDISEFTFLKLGTGWQRKTANRADINVDAGGDEPTVFYETFGSAQLRYKADKLLIDATTKLTISDFTDTPAGAAELENDQNDRWRWETRVRVGWEEWRGTTLFVQPFLIVERNFINPDNSGVTRGLISSGSQFGFTYDLTAVTFLEGALSLGYINAREPTAEDFFFLTPRIDFVWNPHDSWTFKVGYDRLVAGTNSFTVVNNVNVPDVATVSDTLSLEAQLEVTYELLASAKMDLRLSDTFVNNTSDTGLNTELALLWLMNEHMRLRSFWKFASLGSNDATREFSKHQLGLVLTLHY